MSESESGSSSDTHVVTTSPSTCCLSLSAASAAAAVAVDLLRTDATLCLLRVGEPSPPIAVAAATSHSPAAAVTGGATDHRCLDAAAPPPRDGCPFAVAAVFAVPGAPAAVDPLRVCVRRCLGLCDGGANTVLSAAAAAAAAAAGREGEGVGARLVGAAPLRPPAAAGAVVADARTSSARVPATSCTEWLRVARYGDGKVVAEELLSTTAITCMGDELRWPSCAPRLLRARSLRRGVERGAESGGGGDGGGGGESNASMWAGGSGDCGGGLALVAVTLVFFLFLSFVVVVALLVLLRRLGVLRRAVADLVETGGGSRVGGDIVASVHEAVSAAAAAAVAEEPTGPAGPVAAVEMRGRGGVVTTEVHVECPGGGSSSLARSRGGAACCVWKQQRGATP